MPAAIPGTVVSVGSGVGPGGDTGLTGVNGPTAVSTDANNFATLGSDNLIAVPGSSIWDMRLRSFNAIGNPNGEIDQRNAGTTVAVPATALAPFACDRWLFNHVVSGTGTRTYNVGQTASGGGNLVPGTNFQLGSKYLGVTLTAQQATLAAGDADFLPQSVEGPLLRELFRDVHSISLLVNSSVAGLKFAVALRDSPVTQSFVHLCTIPTANTWTLIQIPNIPVWPSGNFTLNPGAIGYQFSIALACGSTYIAPNADAWVAGNFLGASGMSNFAASPVNSLFSVAMVQHEPGPVCTTLIDKPFSQNYDECLRYYQKTYNYAAAIGSTGAAGNGFIQMALPATFNPNSYLFFKKSMAKTPTLTGYSQQTGTINTIRDATAGVDRTITSTANPGENGFNGFGISAANAGAWWANFHYTADTSW